MLFGKNKSSQPQQTRRKTPGPSSSSFPPWRKCCFGLCAVSTGARLVSFAQILLAVTFLVATVLGYTGHHESSVVTDSLLIAVITHTCLALLCAALVFLALHFQRPWLLVFELVFLILAILEYLAASVIFEIYVLRDGLKWLTGRTYCYSPTDFGQAPQGFVCKPIPEEEWPTFDWWNLCMAGVYLGAVILNVWWFNVVLRSYFYLRKKSTDERRRREKAAETLGLLGAAGGGGGGLVAACGGGGGGGGGGVSMASSNATHSRSTLTTSLTTTYDHSRDPDLLLRY